jgi:hypothetical protein
MNWPIRVAALTLLLALVALLAGCPGMPGAPGGAGSAAQQTPPGILPPPGLDSGGVRTLMGTTVTPPNNQILLVGYTISGRQSEPVSSVRRLTFVDGGVLLEGLNYDAREKKQEKDRNEFVPMARISALSWKYEPKPTPPAPAPAKPAPSASRAQGAPKAQRGP